MALCPMITPDRSIGVIAESDRGCSVLGAWYIHFSREKAQYLFLAVQPQTKRLHTIYLKK